MSGPKVCPACGEANQPGSRFCGRCGASLGEGERKQVTVLFCDVVGSMELAERTDPEAWQRVMERVFAILSAGIHRFEGTVDKFTGDGAMALFGAPIAHEDHAQRACYAALHLQRELASYAAELRRAEELSLSVRMGLNSGEVVVGAIGDDLTMSYTALGHTVGLAQRMESLAEPGKAYLTEHTAALVEGYLAVSDLGEFRVKGSSRPLRVFELAGPGSARGRLDVSRARGLSRLVGREREMRILEGALSDAGEGNAGVIGVVGEAGVGKSRLCHELAERCRALGIPVYHAAGQAHARSVPLRPVLELMRAFFGITDEDSDHAARERIAGRLLPLDQGFAEDLPLIFDFLAVPDPERAPPRMDPEARQRRLLELTRRLVHAQGAAEPRLTLFEDLHWIDPASEAFLANFVDATGGTCGLMVVNFRPGYRAPWMSRPGYRQISLVPLGPEHAGRMLAELLGSHPSLTGLAQVIGKRTGGNPFFIEEVVRSLAEAGSLAGAPGSHEAVRPVDGAAVPPTVQAVLAARIDRLPEREKAVLQAAAVIGREFSQPVLARVCDLSTGELAEALRGLVSGEFVHEQGLYPEAVHAFEHPLTQEVAYRSQLGERRAATHALVAEAVAEQYADRLDERAALLADHWEAAGAALEAARWHARAGAWAGTHEPARSLEHWRRVRELADSLPESDETMALGLSSRIFMLNFGWRLGITREEAEALFAEGERIATRSGDIHSRAILLTLYGGIRGVGGGELREFAELTRRALALAEETGDPGLYLTTALGGYSLFVIGEIEEALAVFERAIELAGGDPSVGAGIAVACPLANCIAFKGGMLINLGRLTEAAEAIEQGARLAREQDDIETLGWTHGWSAWLAYFRGDREAQIAEARQALAIAERIGDSFWRAWSWYWLGFAHLERGELRDAIEAVERSGALSRERRTGVEAEPFRLAVLGEAHARLGDPERGRRLAAQAIELARRQEVRNAELFAQMLMARISLGAGAIDASASAAGEIEAALARGLELAAATKQRAFEPLLRVELAELARRRGDADGHQRVLREAHRLCTELGATARAERIGAELATPAG